MNGVQNHPVAQYLETHCRLPYWSQAMGVIGVLEEMGMLKEDAYGPPPKGKVIGIKVDLKKLVKLIKQLFQKKNKKCTYCGLPLKYSEKWETWLCPICDGCKQFKCLDPECKFCKGLPERSSDRK